MLVRAHRGDGSPSPSPHKGTRTEMQSKMEKHVSGCGEGKGEQEPRVEGDLTSDKVVISGDLVPVPRHPEVSRLFSGNISLGLFVVY